MLTLVLVKPELEKTELCDMPPYGSDLKTVAWFDLYPALIGKEKKNSFYISAMKVNLNC